MTLTLTPPDGVTWSTSPCHTRVQDAVYVCEGDDLPRLEPDSLSLLHFYTAGLHAQ